MRTPLPPAPDTDLVAYLERLLAAAREHRLLFLVTSAGVTAEAARAPTTLALDTRPLLGGSEPSDTPPVRKYNVELGVFTGASAEGLAPESYASAGGVCVAGARMAAAALAKELAARADAQRPAPERVS